MLLGYLRLKGEKTFRIQSDGFKCVNNNLFVLNMTIWSLITWADTT